VRKLERPPAAPAAKRAANDEAPAPEMAQARSVMAGRVAEELSR
jgi:hypothetical protein